jgi:ABC-type amino acid transport substrate-binding protein
MRTDGKILAVLTWLFLPGLAAHAASFDDIMEKGVITVAIYRDFPPFSVRQGSELAGIDVDLAKAIGQRMKLTVEFMELTAGETVDDDLRNGVWKGHYLERRVADVMMHIPTDRPFALRNSQVVIFGPYFRERVVVARNPERVVAGDSISIFAQEKVGVELDSLADLYLTGAEGGRFVANVVHYPSVAKAAHGLVKGEVGAVMANASELAAALGKAAFPMAPMEMPGVVKPAWELGLAVKENNRQLAYAMDDVLTALRKDGTVAAIFHRHGIPYGGPEE